MLQNYFKIALRHLQRHPGYSLINVLGLAVGVAGFVLILLYVQDELSYDRYHDNADRIFRVVELIEGAEESSSQPFPTGPTLMEEFPHLIEASVRFFNLQAPSLTLVHERPDGQTRLFSEERFFFADSTVFEVFDFELVRGDAATALDRPGTVVLTEAAARRYFDDADPIGKVLRFENEHDLEVTGVLAEVPLNSHFQFDLLASFSTLRSSVYAENPEQLERWYWNPAWTYVQLDENATQEALEAQFPDFVDKHFHPAIKEQTSLYLQPLTDIHLHSRLDFEIAPNSDAAYVYIFSVIAFFILLIACINFMNLATARSAQRAKEVGMRKVLGAHRGQLIKQFLGESILLTALAVLLAIPLVALLLPVLNNVADKALTLGDLGLWLPLTLLGIIATVGVVSGLYPAFFLSAFQPVSVLKGGPRLGGSNAAAFFRKGLVVAQFAISIALIAGTFVALQQLHFLRNARLGFDKEEVVMVPILRTPVAEKYETVKNALLEHPGVRVVTIAEEVPGARYQTATFFPEGLDEPVQFQRNFVHNDFTDALGLEVVAGRGYSEAFPNDPRDGVVINEAMVRHLGWGTPQEAVGRKLVNDEEHPRYVVGVVKDFHHASLHQPIGPFVLQRLSNNPGGIAFFGRYLLLRVAPRDVPATLDHVRQTWAAFVPDRPFTYFFLDDELDQLYRAEEKLSKVAGAFAILAILVACLGLFALAAFSAEQRTKEIGVRKVFGATVPRIVLRLTGEFTRLVLVALVVAVPLAYLAFDAWLDNFAYRAEVHWSVFLLAGLSALAVAWVTVGYQAIKAARINPVESLRYE